MTDAEPGRVEPVEDEAKRIVRNGQREASYGPPLQDFTRTAAMWSAILGVDVTPEQMALCMAALKISRLVATPDHHDSMVDLVGYMICYQRIVEGEPTPKANPGIRNAPHGTFFAGPAPRDQAVTKCSQHGTFFGFDRCPQCVKEWRLPVPPPYDN